VYVGTGIYALEDEEFNNRYIQFVPFGADFIGFLEDQKFKYNLKALSQKESNKDLVEKIESLTTSIKPSGATWKAVTDSTTSAANSNEKASISSAVSAKHEPTVSSSSTAATTNPGLPLIRISNDTDPLVASAIHSLNDLITSVNESKQTKEHIKKITEEVKSLAKSINEVKEASTKGVQIKAQEEAAKVSRLVEARANELKIAIAAQEEKWSRDFRSEQQRLTIGFNERLQNEVTAATKAILAAANNLLLGAHVEREKKFTNEISERIDKERSELVTRLDNLANSVSEIEELTTKAQIAIEESERATQLHIAIDRLKRVIERGEPEGKGLKPYLEAIRKNAGDDTLLNAALDSIPAAVYETGVLSRTALSEKFKRVEPEISKASLLPPNAGVLGHIGSLLFSKLLWKKEGNATGADIESILSRANNALSEGRISDAVTEVNALKGWPKQLAHDWIVEGRKRSEVEFLVDILSEEGKLLEI
jgi:mitofilin